MKERTEFRSARIFDGESETLRTNANVVVEGGFISEISERPQSAMTMSWTAAAVS